MTEKATPVPEARNSPIRPTRATVGACRWRRRARASRRRAARAAGEAASAVGEGSDEDGVEEEEERSYSDGAVLFCLDLGFVIVPTGGGGDGRRDGAGSLVPSPAW